MFPGFNDWDASGSSHAMVCRTFSGSQRVFYFFGETSRCKVQSCRLSFVISIVPGTPSNHFNNQTSILNWLFGVPSYVLNWLCSQPPCNWNLVTLIATTLVTACSWLTLSTEKLQSPRIHPPSNVLQEWCIQVRDQTLDQCLKHETMLFQAACISGKTTASKLFQHAGSQNQQTKLWAKNSRQRTLTNLPIHWKWPRRGSKDKQTHI